jgi:hypothetical protein
VSSCFFVDRRQGLDRFDLYDHLVIHNQVSAKAGFDAGALIDHRDLGLAHDPPSPLFQLPSQGQRINTFQQTWAEGRMNAIGGIHNLSGQVIFGHLKINISQRRKDRKEERGPWDRIQIRI